MKIDKVTITGADDRTTYNDLLNLQDDFPFVEWGILFSESKEAQPRYPSAEHRRQQFIGDLNLSAHFCGWWARQVIEEGNYRLISDLPKQYRRVQLNYNFGNSAKFRLDWLRNFAQYTDRRIILQLNRSNIIALDKWLATSNVPSRVHFLYDASGGRGTVIHKIQAPIGGHYTGYAGGITIENLDSICCDILRMNNDDSVWVDLESGARSRDNEFDVDMFDLELVRMLLEKFSLHVNRK